MQPKTQNGEAFGKPGIEPRWTRGDKDAIGTAYSASSRLWFTLGAGIVNEVYFPTIDRPQVRDLQYLITDGDSFVHDERRHLTSRTREISDSVLGYEITNTDPDGRYKSQNKLLLIPLCLSLIHTRVADESIREKLDCLPHAAPELCRLETADTYTKNGTFLPTMATSLAGRPPRRPFCDALADMWANPTVDGPVRQFEMDWEFASAKTATQHRRT
jgi:hypothetical protein